MAELRLLAGGNMIARDEPLLLDPVARPNRIRRPLKPSTGDPNRQDEEPNGNYAIDKYMS